MLASLLRIILLTATLKILERGLDKGPIIFKLRRLIDVIAKMNPILIIDEPQSVEGKQTKESLKHFNPLVRCKMKLNS